MREKGNIFLLLLKAQHHVRQPELMMMAPEYRCGLVAGELQTAIQQLEKIRRAAEAARCDEVIRILDEQVEFGHDW